MKTNCSPAWMARMGAGLSGSFASLSDTRGCSTSLSKSEVSFVIVLVADTANHRPLSTSQTAADRSRGQDLLPRSPNKRCGWTEHNLNPGFPARGVVLAMQESTAMMQESRKGVSRRSTRRSHLVANSQTVLTRDFEVVQGSVDRGRCDEARAT